MNKTCAFIIIATSCRLFLPPEHQRQFDVMVSGGNTSDGYDVVQLQRRNSQPSVGRSLGMLRKHSARNLGSVPNLTVGTRCIKTNCYIKSSSEFLHRLVQIDRSRRGFGLTLGGSSPVFIQTVNHDGDAVRAGLRAGDQILEINGLNVRYVFNAFSS